jgi:hypothetical protein
MIVGKPGDLEKPVMRKVMGWRAKDGVGRLLSARCEVRDHDVIVDFSNSASELPAMVAR